MYAKIFGQIFDSSIADDYELRHFFMDLIVLADLNGVVNMTPGAISARTRIPLGKVSELLAKLEAPDPESQSAVENGARIRRLDAHRTWGWEIVNYLRYRAIASEEQRREATKIRTRKWREHKDKEDCDASVTSCDAGDAMQREKQKDKDLILSRSTELNLPTETVEELAEKIYRLYPLKVKKPSALRAIIKAIKKYGFSHVESKTKDYAAVRNGDMEFMPHPATWFNEECFNDSPSNWPRKAHQPQPRQKTSSDCI